VFFVQFLRRAHGTWSEANDKGQADDSQFLEGDFATVEYRISQSLLNHKLELLASKINLLEQMALEIVDGDN
jgi:hypothetical protein